jgi:hypothetical protein
MTKNDDFYYCFNAIFYNKAPEEESKGTIICSIKNSHVI